MHTISICSYDNIKKERKKKKEAKKKTTVSRVQLGIIIGSLIQVQNICLAAIEGTSIEDEIDSIVATTAPIAKRRFNYHKM